MTPETAVVVSSTIGAVSAVAVAVVGYVGARQHRHTREALAENSNQTAQVLHQVKNDHGTNLRDDLDARFQGLHDKLERVEAAQGYLGGTVGHLIRDVKTTLSHQRDHEAASGLIVSQLQKRDDDLEAELRRHHPLDG